MPTPIKTKAKKMKCKYCGTEFIRTSRPTQRYCSTGCRLNHANVRVTARRAKARANIPLSVLTHIGTPNAAGQPPAARKETV